jgi:hypothetical protein
MPHVTPSLQIKCLYCKEYTATKEPIQIKKVAKHDSSPKYVFSGICGVCGKPKVKTLTQAQIQLLPNEITSAKIPSLFNNSIERNGGVLPLVALIPMIIAGISALASAGGATATAVLKAKENAENERHHKQLEALVPGGTGAGPGDASLSSGPAPLRGDRSENEATGDKPTLTGSSLSLFPVVDSAQQNYSDEELVGRAIAFLTRKGFTVSLR